MDVNKELEAIFNDPLLNITDREKSLYEFPKDMRIAIKERNDADYIAKRKLCENFAPFHDMFLKIHQDLRTGRRSVVRLKKTANVEPGLFFLVSGQLVYLESMKAAEWKENVRGMNARTRCIYENGTESDIYLQTLRKNVMTDGYVVTLTDDEANAGLSVSSSDLTDEDVQTGYIYVLSSLAEEPEIKNVKNLYKIGFTTGTVEQRIANAKNDPTYLMADVKIAATYRVYNVDSQKFENLIHQVFGQVNFSVIVNDEKGFAHNPKEWYVAPLGVIDAVIGKIQDGSIVHYTYNAERECLERMIESKELKFDTSNIKVLTLHIKRVYFDDIIKGQKKIEYRQIKPSTVNRYTILEEDGKRYLRHYDALKLLVGYDKDCEKALVQVIDITYNQDEGIVEYHLGMVWEHVV